MPSPRKGVLYHLLSLDGGAEEPSEWISDDGPELIADLAKKIESQDDVLLGRGTYDYWVGYCPRRTYCRSRASSTGSASTSSPLANLPRSGRAAPGSGLPSTDTPMP